MKIKKSELLALIKEEIMSEMDGLTIMDDPRDDDAVPAGMEPGGTMDLVADMMEHAIMKSMDESISMISNHLVTTESNRGPRQLMMRGMDMLRDAGFSKPNADALEKMIAGDDDDGMMQEARLQEGVGMPEIMAFVNAVIKFASDPVTAPLVAAVVAGTPLMLAFEQYSEMKKKKEGGK